eukprot:866443-Pleurochrysis_carterae.AAC.1
MEEKNPLLRANVRRRSRVKSFSGTFYFLARPAALPRCRPLPLASTPFRAFFCGRVFCFSRPRCFRACRLLLPI